MKFKLKSTNDVIVFSLISVLKRIFLRNEAPIFFSSVYGIEFSSLAEYWMELGKRNALIELIARQKQRGIRGFSFEELIQKMSTLEFGSGVGVVLFNINLVVLGRTLDRFPGIDASVFKEDYVFIPVSSREEAKKLISRISPMLAEALAIDKGLIFLNNEVSFK